MEDGAMNGVMIPPNKTTLDEAVNKALNDGKPNLAKQIIEEFENSGYHSGPHEKYTKKIIEKLDDLKDEFNSIPNKTEEVKEFYKNEVLTLKKEVRNKIQNAGNININELDF